ncbi:MAG: hypothetical protein QNK35_02620 [Bacteroides sp.]|nr:hypothetical protein [Bacteroides sp.]
MISISHKTKNRIALWIPLAIISMALLSCQPGIKEQELSDLKSKNIELIQQMVTQQSEIHLQQRAMDSLETEINHLEQQVAGLSSKAPEPDSDELEIRQLVERMHVSWKKLAPSKDPDEILQYFMPMFMASQIDINDQAKGGVAAYTDLDYGKFLEEIISRKKFSVEFGDVTFLDVSVKDGEYFNLAYKCQMRQYNDDALSESSSVMVTITGRKVVDAWKIANYSVVSFEYREQG